MKNLKIILLYTLVISQIQAGLANAEKMSLESQTLVIQKLERVLSQLDKESSNYLPSQLRLADLLSERARQRFMLEIESNCQNCKGSQADRDQAIRLYEASLEKLNINEKSQVFFQLAHLYQISGKMDKSQTLFENILKVAKTSKISKSILTKTYASLGDIYFQKSNFKTALNFYNQALNDKNLENRALVIYNKAWCEFNLDQTNKAIATLRALVSNPKQITRIQGDKETYDEGFHTDLVKDLATFYSRQKVTNKEISTIEHVMPQAQRKVILSHFAAEADRLGQKSASHIIWDKYLQDPTLTKEEKLQAYVSKSQVNFDGGRIAQSNEDFAKAAEAFKKQRCEELVCENTRKTMKNYVTEMHRFKKLKPDQELLTAYVIYTNTFPKDKEMQQRAASVALDAGNYPEAVKFYRNVAENKEFTKIEKEDALIAQMGAAEQSNNESLKQESYTYYLRNSINETKKFEVEYQLVYQNYQQKKLNDAYSGFKRLALNKNGAMDLRIKAADLALDVLAQQKNDQEIEDTALQLAKALPTKRSEYELLARKSIINQTAHVANNKNSSTSDYRSQLNRIWKTDLKTASVDEKIQFYTNAAVLANKINDDEALHKAQLALLNQPKVSESQKQEIYKNRVAYFEKKLDFKQAYSWAKKINFSSTADKEIRLATLADLAGLSPIKHYNLALKSGLSGQGALMAQSRLVLLAKKPNLEVKKYVNSLKRDPKLFNDTLLLVYSKTGDKRTVESLAKTKELRSQPVSNYFNQHKMYDDLISLQKKFSLAKLKVQPVKALQRTTAERVNLLKKADQMLAASLSAKDIVAQMMSLDMISSQNERLTRELLTVPEPRGLTKAQKAQYEKLLLAQLKPFADKSKLAGSQKQEIWNGSKALSDLINDYKMARPEIQKLMSRQMNLLVQVSGDGSLKSELRSVIKENRANKKDLTLARMSVSENPNNKSEIEKLKILETEIGHPLMVAFLETRLNHLKKENKL